MTKPALDPAQAQALLRAELARLRAENASLRRHVAHQQLVLAVIVRRLGGFVRIHESALARAAELWDLEVGEAGPLQVPAEDGTVRAFERTLAFRLVDRATGRDIDPPALINLPQVVRDLAVAASEAAAPGADEKARRRLEWAARCVAAIMDVDPGEPIAQHEGGPR